MQVLDDSTDETTAIARRKVAEWQAKGVDISLLHRTNRTGFKAGGPHYVARFATERVVCIDTTAAGGNATLLAS